MAHPEIAKAVGCALLFAAACATEETVRFGEPARVTGAASSTSASASTGGACQPDAGCATSFADVVAILEGPGACSDAACHARPVLGFQLVSGDAAAAHAALLAYELEGRGPYVVPCDPEASKMLCNLRVDPDAGASRWGSCGSTMPKAIDDGVDDRALSLDEVGAIAEWIACGASAD
jgi:hypothetical protein